MQRFIKNKSQSLWPFHDKKFYRRRQMFAIELGSLILWQQEYSSYYYFICAVDWWKTVVMGRDSCSEGRGFESRYRILDGHFFTYICCKNCIVCLKRPKMNEKVAGVGPFLKKDEIVISCKKGLNQTSFKLW